MSFGRKVAIVVAVVGAFTVGVVGAAAATASPSPSASGKNYAQVFVDKLAGILHINSSEAQKDLKQAELQTIQQMLADGQITQAQAKALTDRVNAGQGFGILPFKRPGFGFGPERTLMGDVKKAELNAVASTLKLSVSDLQSKLRSGQSLAQIEQAQGVSDAAVKDAEKAAAKKVLDGAVKAGTITQAQEDQFLSHVGSEGPGFGRHHFGGFGPFGGFGAPPAPEDGSTI
jgi:polyhydroxyalkanoate synthesis regulator phasin